MMNCMTMQPLIRAASLKIEKLSRKNINGSKLQK